MGPEEISWLRWAQPFPFPPAHAQSPFTQTCVCVDVCTETRQINTHCTPRQTQSPSLSTSLASHSSWDGVRGGSAAGWWESQVSRGMSPVQIRDGEGSCHCPGLWHWSSASCRNWAFFLLLCWQRMKCVDAFHPSRSLSLGRMLGFLKKPLLHQQTGRQKVRWEMHPK